MIDEHIKQIEDIAKNIKHERDLFWVTSVKTDIPLHTIKKISNKFDELTDILKELKDYY